MALYRHCLKCNFVGFFWRFAQICGNYGFIRIDFCKRCSRSVALSAIEEAFRALLKANK